MAWQIELSKEAEKQIDKLGTVAAKRILAFLHERVSSVENPRQLGAALTGSRFGEFWKYRVGDYRIVCQLQDQSVKVLVIKVGHRSDVYN
jgi:mRNA interferase RelE/StbE